MSTCDNCSRLQEQVETLRKERDVAVAAMVRNDNRAEAAEAERDRLREALREIENLEPTPIADTPFCTGPLSLFRAAQRIAHAALQKEPQP